MAWTVDILEGHVFDDLTPFLRKEGFVLHKHMKQYRRDTSTGSQSITISMAGDGPYTLDVHLGIRSELVEALVYQFLSGPKHYASYANTIIAPLARAAKGAPRGFRFDQPEELSGVVSHVMELISSGAFRFFDRHVTIQSLHELLNDQPEKPTRFLYNQLHRCFRGLIVAKMADSPSFFHLMDVYHQTLLDRGAPREVMRGYDSLSILLANFSLN